MNKVNFYSIYLRQYFGSVETLISKSRIDLSLSAILFVNSIPSITGILTSERTNLYFPRFLFYVSKSATGSVNAIILKPISDSASLKENAEIGFVVYNGYEMTGRNQFDTKL